MRFATHLHLGIAGGGVAAPPSAGDPVGAVGAAGRWSWRRFHHVAQALTPLAGCGVFLGLSALTASLLRAEGVALHWVGDVRAALLPGAWLWSVWLAGGILRRASLPSWRLALAVLPMAAAAGLAAASGIALFWGR